MLEGVTGLELGRVRRVKVPRVALRQNPDSYWHTQLPSLCQVSGGHHGALDVSCMDLEAPVDGPVM